MAHHFTPSYMYIARYRGGHWTGQTLIMHEKRRGTPSSRQKQLPSSSAITDILFPLSSVNQGNKEGRKEGGREGEVSTVSALLFPLILPSYREGQQFTFCMVVKMVNKSTPSLLSVILISRGWTPTDTNSQML